LPPSPPPFVRVFFAFGKDERLGTHADLYWLSANATEHLYTSIPAGMQAQETTLPGECWRARDHDSGNLLCRYCASEDPVQHVQIRAVEHPVVDFYYPAGALTARHANVYELHPTPENPTQRQYIGMLAQKEHLTAQAGVGARFVAFERGTNRRLLSSPYVVTAEAEQHVSLGSRVSVEFVSPRSTNTSRGFDVYRVSGLRGEEHLHAKLAPGAALRVETSAGEQWIVREPASDRRVLTVNATQLPFQRVFLPTRPL